MFFIFSKSKFKRAVPEVLARFARQIIREFGVDDDDRLAERFSHRLRTTAHEMKKEREAAKTKKQERKNLDFEDTDTSDESELSEHSEEEIDIDDDEDEDSLLSATDRDPFNLANLPTLVVKTLSEVALFNGRLRQY